jgi:N-acetylglucosamine kinase-like BadF-type ATPase
MKRSRFVIGIDGGGTKTIALIADDEGKVLAERSAGPTNPQILGFKKSAQTLLSLILQCSTTVNCPPRNLCALTIGLAGAGRATDQRKMKNELNRMFNSKKIFLRKIRIESDARVAVEGAFNGNSGIVLIAGTGSIALAKDSNGKIYRSGGWGRLLGDEGSGFSIGRDGLNAVAWHLDGRLKTMLAGKVAREFKLKTQGDIMDAVYRKDFDVARIAPIVIKSASQRDEVCETILRKASFELTELTASLLMKVGKSIGKDGKNKIRLAFIGGLLVDDNFFSKMVRRDILKRIPSVRIVKPFASPADGAVLMALSSL